jgi:putative membrane protein insertion efficiency factor
VSQVAKLILLGALWFYRLVVSPIFYMLGARCRFHPSCSVYAQEAIRHYGPWRGAGRAARRLCKCHPFHPGGFDPPVPEQHG